MMSIVLIMQLDGCDWGKYCLCGRTLLPKEANVKRARHTLLFDPKLESSRGRTTPINEGIPAPETPRNWRIAWRVIQLRYVGWTWDSGLYLLSL